MARFKPKNRIRCTSTTTGTGAYTIGPASAGFQDFSLLNNGDRFPYTAQFGTNWECGCGEKQGTTLIRHAVYESTNGNSQVNWGAGTKFLFVDKLAEQEVFSPDGSIAINDNFATGKTELVGYSLANLLVWFEDNFVAGVDLEKVETGAGTEQDPTQLTLNVVKKLQNVADSGTIALDFAASLGSTKVVTIAGNRTITFTGARVGQQFSVRLIYDVAGSRVPVWPSTVKWVNGYTPAHTPVGSSSDTFEFERVASTGPVQYIGWITSTERPVILNGESAANVDGSLVIVDGVNPGPNEFQWLTATIDSDYNDYTLTKTGIVSSGTFDLTIGIEPEDNQTISNIPFNITAFGLLTLIWANTTLDETEINLDGLVDGAGSLRTLSSDGSLHLQFIGGARYAGYVITIDSANLVGGGSYGVSSVGSGSGSDPWPFTGATYTNQTMKFRYNGVDSAAVAVNANASTIAAAVGAITGIGVGNVLVKRLAIGSYYFEFIAGKSGTDMPFEIQFSPSFLPSSSIGAATGQLYSTARNGAGPTGSNETNTISITGSPTQGSLLYTVLDNAIVVPVDAASASLQAQLDTAIGVGNSIVTGGPLPATPLVVTFIGAYLTTNIANSTLDDSGAGSEDIDWSICEGKVITLLPGNGTYTLRHVRPIPGKTLFVTLTSDGATGDVAWTDIGIGVPVNWGPAGVPDIPLDTESLYLEFYAETINDIHGRIWFSTGSGGGLVTSVFSRVGDVVAEAGDYTASQVTFVATGTIAATNVQDAIEEIDAEFSERVDDRVAALLVEGVGVTLTYADGPNTLTISSEVVDLATALVPGYSIEIDQVDDTFVIHNLWTTEVVTDGATITVDLDPELGGDKVVTIEANRNFDVTNEVLGKEFKLQVIQGEDATVDGGYLATFLFEVEWLEGFQPAQTPVTGKSDEWHFLCVRIAEMVGSTLIPAKFKGWVETTERPKFTSPEEGSGSEGGTLNGMRAYWDLEETGTADRLDSSANNFDLDISASQASSAGLIGNCHTTPGEVLTNVSDVLEEGDFTIACWIMYLDHSQTESYFFQAGNCSLSRRATGILSSQDRTNFTVDGTVISSNFGGYDPGSFHLVVGRYNATTQLMRLSINGTDTGFTTVSGTPAIAGGIQIGYSLASGGVSGAVDEAAVWNRELTNNEITFLYNSGNARAFSEQTSGSFLIDWAVADSCDIVLDIERDEYLLEHANIIKGKTIHVSLLNDGLSTDGILNWDSGVNVDWGDAQPPTVPGDAEELHLEFYAHTLTDIKGRYWFEQGVAVNTRISASIGTAYQPSTARNTQVSVSVEISTGAAGDGKLELLCDAANPPTTVRGTFRVGTALTVIGGQLTCIVPAGHYWKIVSTSTGGSPTFSIVGNVQEVSL